MENYHMACSCGRPYNRTCGMNCQQPMNEMVTRPKSPEPAMAYVPSQEFTDIFDLSYALNVGTVFPQLCKPFCGKRGGFR